MLHHRAGAARTTERRLPGPKPGPGPGPGPVEPETLHRSRDLCRAITHRRPFYRGALALRALSFACSALIFGSLGVWQHVTRYPNVVRASWGYGAPTAGIALIWDLLDMAILAIHENSAGAGTATSSANATKASGNRACDRKVPLFGFCWAYPWVHLTVHLVIWLGTLLLAPMLWVGALVHLRYLAGKTFEPGNGGLSLATKEDAPWLWIVLILQALLIVSHYVLLVLACVATNDARNEYANNSTVVFAPRTSEGGKTEVVTLPSSLWEVWRPRKLPVVVSASEYLTV